MSSGTVTLSVTASGGLLTAPVTVIITLSVPTQPLPSVTVRLYIIDEVNVIVFGLWAVVLLNNEPDGDQK